MTHTNDATVAPPTSSETDSPHAVSVLDSASPPTQRNTVRNRKRRQKHPRASEESANDASISGTESELAPLQALNVIPAQGSSSIPPPPPPPPVRLPPPTPTLENARLAVERAIDFIVLTAADVCKGLLQVLNFIFITFQKPMCVQNDSCLLMPLLLTSCWYCNSQRDLHYLLFTVLARGSVCTCNREGTSSHMRCSTHIPRHSLLQLSRTHER